jgi:hypothetical protein
MMRTACRAALILQLALPAALALAAEPISVELNGGEMLDNRCVLTFVVENKSKDSFDTLRLNMFVFNQENRVYRRMVTEMGPLRGEKTVVKLYPIDGPCTDIRSVLVSDVSACAPAKPDVCLDNLALSSRMPNVRFYK